MDRPTRQIIVAEGNQSVELTGRVAAMVALLTVNMERINEANYGNVTLNFADKKVKIHINELLGDAEV